MSTTAHHSPDRLEGPVLSWDQPMVDALDRVEKRIGWQPIEWDCFGFSGPMGGLANGHIHAYPRAEPTSEPIVFRAMGHEPSQVSITEEYVFVDAVRFASRFQVTSEQAREVMATVACALSAATAAFNAIPSEDSAS